MTLIDTCVWVDHFRIADLAVSRLLLTGDACTHPFVIGEIALGRFAERAEILGAFMDLPRLAAATDEEVLALIERAGLEGAGIGYVDAHLLAAARLSSARMWTRDRRLARVASRLDLAYAPSPPV